MIGDVTYGTLDLPVESGRRSNDPTGLMWSPGLAGSEWRNRAPSPICRRAQEAVLSSSLRRVCVAPVIIIALAVSLLVSAAGASTSPKVGPPQVMTSFGDSITRGFHTGGLLQDVPANSWSTGTNPTVNSLASRIDALDPAPLARVNGAVTGAKMVGLAGQVNAAAVPAGTDLYTVLLGANDACTANEASMTPVATYRQQFEAGMQAISAKSPDALVFVASIPDIYRLWDIGKSSFGARFAWGLYGICQSMLADAGGSSTATVQRRQRVRARVVEYNTQLEQVCAEYLRCRFDDNAAFNTPFVLSDMSTIDYFHPNVTGQAKAARVLWPALFDFTDTVAPDTIIDTDRDADGVDGWYRDDVTVTLSSEAVDLRGSEYDFRIQGDAGNYSWARYDEPFAIDAEGVTQVTGRSVDVNGNVGAGEVRDVKIDKTKPTFDLDCPSGPTVVGGTANAVIANAADETSGFVADPDGIFPLDTSVAGTYTHQSEIQDRAGNTETKTCQYVIVYGFGGIQQPVNADGSSVFKLGSTVPLKFRLTDIDNAARTDAEATVKSVAKLSGTVWGSDSEAVSTSAATTGTAFRVSDGQYIFNLATKGRSVGTYKATIALTGGQEHEVVFSLR